jgi:hypothetical protein
MRPSARIRGLVVAERLPHVALAGVAVGATVVYAVLVRLVQGPHVFGDELYYGDAATSLADGHGLEVRGESYGFGPLYPALLALVRLPASSQPASYPWWLTVNAAAIALTSVPAYFLARRLLAPWWSVGVAALAAAIPSAFYAGAVMTDCLGYLTAVTALLAIVLAVERPSVQRQLAVIAAVALATSVRTQFVALYATYLLAGVFRWLLEGRPPPPRSIRQWWPTVATVAAFGLAVVAAVATGRSASSLLGGYSDLARGYPLLATGRWAVEHVFDLTLYFGLVGGAAAPLAIGSLYGRARSRSVRDAAFIATTVSATVTAILVVAAFSATQFGLGRLHDRYLFYVVPAWLVVLAAWAARGGPGSRRLAVVSAAAFFLFVVAMPYGRLIVPDGAKMFDGPGTAVWATFQDWLARTPSISGRRVLAGASLLAALWVVAIPRRLAWTALVVVAVSFVGGGVIMWKRTIDDSNKGVFRDSRVATRGWVDRVVPANASVTLVTVGSPFCDATLWRYSSLFTEFFNGRVRQVPYIGHPLAVGPPTHPLHVASSGLVETDRNVPLRTTYVVVPKGVDIVGRKLAAGTNAPLALWRTAGSVRLARARSDADVVRTACR